MTIRRIGAACIAVLLVSGCAFQGVNTLPLPGAVGRGSDALVYHVELANVGTLEPNSPVMINDVVVGSVGAMTVERASSGMYAVVDVAVEPGTVVAGNAVASVGQTSLLGSMHVQLNPPLGQRPSGRLPAGSTIPLSRSSTYPSTEQTLSSLSLIVNQGGLGKFGDIIHSLNTTVSGREPQIRALLGRLDVFIGTLDRQRDDIVATITALNRLAATFADQRDTITEALRKLPAALDVLIRERPRLTEALRKLGEFAETATRLVDMTQDDLVTNLRNLEPTIKALADVGPGLDFALAAATVFPFGQDVVDRAMRGDYANLYAAVDITVPRLKRTLLLGTRWAQPNAPLVAAPGEPYFTTYGFDPVGLPAVIPQLPGAAAPVRGVVPPPPPESVRAATDTSTPFGDPLGMYPPAAVLPPPPGPADGPR